MWNYVKLHSDNSPMAEILSQCSDKSNLRLVIYHLSENHVECATVSPNEVHQLSLGETARVIRNDARNGVHAILAFDVRANDVYLIDSTPELQIASAVLLCVVTELLNGNVLPRQCECGRPEVRRQEPKSGPVDNSYDENFYDVNEAPRFEAPRERFIPTQEVARRDASGRFVSKANVEAVPNDEPWKNPPAFESASTVMNRRFRLGRR